MDFNKIQSVLESLPDQDIAKYAQQPSPQVPQVLAQMELQRRATLRQSAQMQNKGGIGMAAGGVVKRYNKGGPLQFGAMSEEYLTQQEKILEEAKRKRGEQMKGGFLGGLGDLIGDGVTAFKNAAQRAIDKDRTAFANDRADAALAEGPTDFQKGLVPAKSAQDISVGTPAVEPPNVAAGVEPPAVPNISLSASETDRAPKKVDFGLGTLAPPGSQPQSPEAAQRMEKLEMALNAKGNALTEAMAKEAELRKSLPVPVDEEKERNRQLYTALGQWGSALLLTRNFGVANAIGIETFQKELEASEEKRAAFKKASVEAALVEVKNRAEMAGFDVDKLKALDDLQSKITTENLALREQARKERDTESDIKYKEGALGISDYTARTGRITATNPKAGGKSEELTFEDALKLAEDQIKNDKINALKYKTPESRQQAVQALALELYNKNLAVLSAVRSGKVPPYPGAATPPAGTSGMIDFNKLPK